MELSDLQHPHYPNAMMASGLQPGAVIRRHLNRHHTDYLVTSTPTTARPTQLGGGTGRDYGVSVRPLRRRFLRRPLVGPDEFLYLSDMGILPYKHRRGGQTVWNWEVHTTLRRRAR